MEIKATFKPGQNGTRQLVQKYGDQLVCVRYRYDKLRQKRYKTVELIVDEQDWMPGVRFSSTERVLIRIGYGEEELRETVKKAGAFWNPEKKAWVLPFAQVLALGLEHRLIDETSGL